MEKMHRLCPYCLEPVRVKYEVDECEGCETVVEGSTVNLTEDEYEMFCETGELPANKKQEWM